MRAETREGKCSEIGFHPRSLLYAPESLSLGPALQAALGKAGGDRRTLLY